MSDAERMLNNDETPIATGTPESPISPDSPQATNTPPIPNGAFNDADRGRSAEIQRKVDELVANDNPFQFVRAIKDLDDKSLSGLAQRLIELGHYSQLSLVAIVTSNEGVKDDAIDVLEKNNQLPELDRIVRVSPYDSTRSAVQRAIDRLKASDERSDVAATAAAVEPASPMEAAAAAAAAAAAEPAPVSLEASLPEKEFVDADSNQPAEAEPILDEDALLREFAASCGCPKADIDDLRCIRPLLQERDTENETHLRLPETTAKIVFNKEGGRLVSITFYKDELPKGLRLPKNLLVFEVPNISRWPVDLVLPDTLFTLKISRLKHWPEGLKAPDQFAALVINDRSYNLKYDALTDIPGFLNPPNEKFWLSEAKPAAPMPTTPAVAESKAESGAPVQSETEVDAARGVNEQVGLPDSTLSEEAIGLRNRIRKVLAQLASPRFKGILSDARSNLSAAKSKAILGGDLPDFSAAPKLVGETQPEHELAPEVPALPERAPYPFYDQLVNIVDIGRLGIGDVIHVGSVDDHDRLVTTLFKVTAVEMTEDGATASAITVERVDESGIKGALIKTRKRITGKSEQIEWRAWGDKLEVGEAIRGISGTVDRMMVARENKRQDFEQLTDASQIEYNRLLQEINTRHLRPGDFIHVLTESDSRYVFKVTELSQRGVSAQYYRGPETLKSASGTLWGTISDRETPDKIKVDRKILIGSASTSPVKKMLVSRESDPFKFNKLFVDEVPELVEKVEPVGDIPVKVSDVSPQLSQAGGVEYGVPLTELKVSRLKAGDVVKVWFGTKGKSGRSSDYEFRILPPPNNSEVPNDKVLVSCDREGKGLLLPDLIVGQELAVEIDGEQKWLEGKSTDDIKVTKIQVISGSEKTPIFSKLQNGLRRLVTPQGRDEARRASEDEHSAELAEAEAAAVSVPALESDRAEPLAGSVLEATQSEEPSDTPIPSVEVKGLEYETMEKRKDVVRALRTLQVGDKITWDREKDKEVIVKQIRDEEDGDPLIVFEEDSQGDSRPPLAKSYLLDFAERGIIIGVAMASDRDLSQESGIVPISWPEDRVSNRPLASDRVESGEVPAVIDGSESVVEASELPAAVEAGVTEGQSLDLPVNLEAVERSLKSTYDEARQLVVQLVEKTKTKASIEADELVRLEGYFVSLQSDLAVYAAASAEDRNVSVQIDAVIKLLAPMLYLIVANQPNRSEWLRQLGRVESPVSSTLDSIIAARGELGKMLLQLRKKDQLEVDQHTEFRTTLSSYIDLVTTYGLEKLREDDIGKDVRVTVINLITAYILELTSRGIKLVN